VRPTATARATPDPDAAVEAAPIAPEGVAWLDRTDGGTALARCMAEVRTAMPPALAGALAVLDDTALTEDGCRLDLAVRGHDPGWCAGVVYAPVREACLRRAAIAARDHASCPRGPGLRARDPLCVALAARDARLCVSAGPVDRITCVAAATHDPRRCTALDAVLRPGCEREVAVLTPLLPLQVLRHALPNTGGLELPGADGGTSWALPGIDRGVFVDTEGTTWVVDATVGWPESFLAPESPRVGVRARPPQAPHDPGLLEVRVELPGYPMLDTRSGSLRPLGPVQWRMAGRQRGARSAASVELVGALGSTPLRFRLWWDSFVRDLIATDTMR